MSTPHKCPVCEGRGHVPAGFYARATAMHNTAPETCKACDGAGVIWPPKHYASAANPLKDAIGGYEHFHTGTPVPPPGVNICGTFADPVCVLPFAFADDYQPAPHHSGRAF